MIVTEVLATSGEDIQLQIPILKPGQKWKRNDFHTLTYKDANGISNFLLTAQSDSTAIIKTRYSDGEEDGDGKYIPSII